MSLELIITLIACVYITIACIFYIITMLFERQLERELWELYHLGPNETPTIEIQRRPSTCVQIEMYIYDVWFTGIGFSKANWPDQWDENEGIRIATSKAIRHIAEQIITEEN